MKVYFLGGSHHGRALDSADLPSELPNVIEVPKPLPRPTLQDWPYTAPLQNEKIEKERYELNRIYNMVADRIAWHIYVADGVSLDDAIYMLFEDFATYHAERRRRYG